MKIYIAGPISTININHAIVNFAEAELMIVSKGHEAINPMTLRHNHDKSWISYMKACIPELLKCDAIYMLKGWKQSKGARMEKALAVDLGIRVIATGTL